MSYINKEEIGNDSEQQELLKNGNTEMQDANKSKDCLIKDDNNSFERPNNLEKSQNKNDQIILETTINTDLKGLELVRTNPEPNLTYVVQSKEKEYSNNLPHINPTMQNTSLINCSGKLVLEPESGMNLIEIAPNCKIIVEPSNYEQLNEFDQSIACPKLEQSNSNNEIFNRTSQMFVLISSMKPNVSSSDWSTPTNKMKDSPMIFDIQQGKQSQSEKINAIPCNETSSDINTNTNIIKDEILAIELKQVTTPCKEQENDLTCIDMDVEESLTSNSSQNNVGASKRKKRKLFDKAVFELEQEQVSVFYFKLKVKMYFWL